MTSEENTLQHIVHFLSNFRDVGSDFRKVHPFFPGFKNNCPYLTIYFNSWNFMSESAKIEIWAGLPWLIALPK